LGTRLSRSYEEGVELSGGQWQRLALARAFFRDAEVLVLDEPSAALDPIAERALFEDLRELCAGRTVIMISHRFSTVRSADRIIVLEDGHLVEEGDHETLLAKRGRYATLFEMQAAPYST
jgi:ATP-binding cassette, subfamily B, bacterial